MARESCLAKPYGSLIPSISSIWRPFTQAFTAGEPFFVEKAQDALLMGREGRQIIDAISSWWVILHGHGRKEIREAIQKQSAKLEHVMFADFTHEPGIALAEKLLQLLPEGFSRVFYSDNGSTAVETAIKIAMQYWHNQNTKTKKKKVLALKNGYHGDTFGAMSVSERGRFTAPFDHAFFSTIYIEPPREGKPWDLDVLLSLLEAGDIACFIFEPAIQGAAGMKPYSLEGLDRYVSLCSQYQVITIADEVMTGFGRTGPDFAVQQLQNKPDIICLAKGLTGGFLPLAATVCTERIYESFVHPELSKALLHGHSYAGNPLGCAAALASLQLLEGEDCRCKRRKVEEMHQSFLKKIAKHPRIAACHAAGTILSLEYATFKSGSYYHPMRNLLAEYFFHYDIFLRPLGNSIHILPPYCITEGQLNYIYEIIEKSLEELPWI